MTTTTSFPSTLAAPKPRGYPIRFPDDERARDQDGEFCEVYLGGRWHRVRLHDYDRIYAVPGLYECLFYDVLRCTSPQRVVSLLRQVLDEAQVSPTTLRVLDLGAGNGMVGERLRLLGVSRLVGLDILPEAAQAARRDRPGLYDEYHVADLCDPPVDVAASLAGDAFNALATVAALGFGDIPPRAFANAFNLLPDDGWIAMNIKESFLIGEAPSGFCAFMRELTGRDILRLEAYRRYVHRLSIRGEPLVYVAIVARKNGEIPDALLDEHGAS